MKKLLFILFALMCVTFQSQAGFIIKKTAKTEMLANSETATMATSRYMERHSTASTETHIKKHSFFSRIVHKLAESAAMPQWLYIVLAVFGLGWLGMAINGGFDDWHWALCLLLYIIFWLPGFIYTLIKMGDYY